MQLLPALTKLGIGSREARVYLGLLESGPATVQNIAKQSGEKRTTVYELIKALRAQGLISESRKGKRRLFAAADPAVLREAQDEKAQILNEVIPRLSKMIGVAGKTPKVRVFEGIQEIQDAYKDTLRNSEREILTIASSKSIIERLGWDWTEHYIKERLRRKIPVRFLTTRSKVASEVVARDKQELRRTRLLPPERDMETDIEIYDGKVLFLSFHKSVVAYLIESEAIYRAMKTLFETLWENSEES